MEDIVSGNGTEPADDDTGAGYHYRLIARAMAEIDTAGGERLALDDLAGKLGMSPAHFQRVFSQWVGVSPKRYQQYLALGHARQLLAERKTVLDTALTAGLSGPGRLHDLFLRWEAMSPGTYARRGAGMTIAWGQFDSPFGPVVAMGTPHGLCGLAFSAETGAGGAFADLSARWPAARYVEEPERLRAWVEGAFGGHAKVPVQVIGAPFQIKVWEALLSIPSGHVATYAQVAAAIGKPRAMRAVGSAVGQNPLAPLIPCHRVIASSGALAGYRWGLPVKRALLAWEGARHDAAHA
ncbi:MAG: methylated-DNA--[protein]-cysteine S-methyltransferase [Pararhodobacter sp.]